MITTERKELIEHLSDASKLYTQIAEKVDKLAIKAADADDYEDEIFEDPLSETIKIATLLKSHSTKIGIISKSPVQESTLKPIRQELDEFTKLITHLMTMSSQLASEKKKYSSNFVKKIHFKASDIVHSCTRLLNELQEILQTDKDDEQRLVLIGKIWDNCDSLVSLVNSGSNGALKDEINSIKSLLVDAKEDLEIWTEDPQPFEADLDELLGENDTTFEDDDEESNDGEEVDPELVTFGKEFMDKIQLLIILLGLLSKNTPKESKYTFSHSLKIDEVFENIKNLSLYVDNVVCNLSIENDLVSSRAELKLLNNNAKALIESFKEINGISDDANDTKFKWVSSWNEKFFKQS